MIIRRPYRRVFTLSPRLTVLVYDRLPYTRKLTVEHSSITCIMLGTYALYNNQRQPSRERLYYVFVNTDQLVVSFYNRWVYEYATGNGPDRNICTHQAVC